MFTLGVPREFDTIPIERRRVVWDEARREAVQSRRGLVGLGLAGVGTVLGGLLGTRLVSEPWSVVTCSVVAAFVSSIVYGRYIYRIAIELGLQANADTKRAEQSEAAQSQQP